MTPLTATYTEVDEGQVADLAAPSKQFYAVEVQPPVTGDIPATVEGFVRGMLEIQTRLLVKNTSPTVVYEIQRPRRDRLWLQFCVPTKRLGRKVRAHLSNEVPGIGFTEGVTRLPVMPGDSIGGGILTTGRKDRFPLRTEFDSSPPINGLISTLHRDSMRDTRYVVQILFKPVAGEPVREWLRKRRSHKTMDFLRKDQEKLRGSRSATPRERKQADLVERKMDQRRFWVSIRFAVIGAGESTASRVKEIAGSFNAYESLDSRQYIDTVTIRGLRQKRFLEFYRALGSRTFGGYSLRFQASIEELAGLVSIPDIDQENIQYAQL
jgi:hypothetical protein